MNETGKVKVKEENQEKSGVAAKSRVRRSSQPRYVIIIVGGDQFRNVTTKQLYLSQKKLKLILTVSELTGDYRLIIPFTQ